MVKSKHYNNMGITSFSTGLINRVLDNRNDIHAVIELGAQNLYDRDYPSGPPYADEFYTRRGLTYTCIDLSAENGAKVIDLSEPVAVSTQYDLVTDFGTSEHVKGIYNCWKTKHDLLRVGGVMISENPKVGNWPGHGYHYYTQDFYTALAEQAGYKIIEIGEHPAMGNVTDGWNIYCVMEKVEDKPFPSEAEWTAPTPGPKYLDETQPVENIAKAIEKDKAAAAKPRIKVNNRKLKPSATKVAVKGKKGSSKKK